MCLVLNQEIDYGGEVIMMFPHKVTVFNILNTEDGDVITKAVIDTALFVKREGTSRNKLGLADADAVVVTIPRARVIESGYLNPFEFDQLTEETAQGKFTFKKGDYIAFGDVDLGGLDVDEFKNRYGNLYDITGVSDFNYGRLAHFRITAK